MNMINDVKIPSFDLKGKTAVITGGSSGIGRAAAIQMAACGANVVIASIPQSQCDQVVREIEAAGGRAIGIETDVSDAAQIDRMIEKTVETFGSIDIMVANAANGGKVLPVLEEPEDEFTKVVDINRKGTWLTDKAAAKQMIKQGRGGRIINTCSIAYIEGRGCHGSYGASKAGVSILTRTMAAEWAEHGINVNAVAPGLTATPITAGLREDKEALAECLKKIPLGRMAEPSEIAAVMTFLASDLASFITGTTVIADGGATVGG